MSNYATPSMLKSSKSARKNGEKGCIFGKNDKSSGDNGIEGDEKASPGTEGL
jgi:hypothetical protein